MNARTLLFLATLALGASCAHAPVTEPSTLTAAPAAPVETPKPQLTATPVGDGGSAAKELADALKDARVYFEFDSDRLEQSGLDTLQKVAGVLRRHGELSIRVEGNCDERGTEEYNLMLGQRRAASAAKYLRDLGVNPDQVATVSYGALRPVDEGHTEEAWAQNRRDELHAAN
ncbi:MAG: OmpA family protein [Myxococcaceae bacterium]